jgi:hypothetical protein
VSRVGIGEDAGATLSRELRGNDGARFLPHRAELRDRHRVQAAEAVGDGGNAGLDHEGGVGGREAA